MSRKSAMHNIPTSVVAIALISGLSAPASFAGHTNVSGVVQEVGTVGRIGFGFLKRLHHAPGQPQAPSVPTAVTPSYTPVPSTPEVTPYTPPANPTPITVVPVTPSNSVYPQRRAGSLTGHVITAQKRELPSRTRIATAPKPVKIAHAEQPAQSKLLPNMPLQLPTSTSPPIAGGGSSNFDTSWVDGMIGNMRRRVAS